MTEEKAEDPYKWLNDLVAVTVVILTVFMAVANVKDDNIVQAMQKAKADAVDTWSEYQASRVKLHLDENGLSTLHDLESVGSLDKALVANQAAEYASDIKKYEARSAETMAKARDLEAEYDRLNYHDDQFDIAEAFIQLAVALAAVAALVERWWLLYVCWGAGAVGMLSGIAGFANLAFHWDWAARLLSS